MAQAGRCRIGYTAGLLLRSLALDDGVEIAAQSRLQLGRHRFVVEPLGVEIEVLHPPSLCPDDIGRLRQALPGTIPMNANNTVKSTAMLVTANSVNSLCAFRVSALTSRVSATSTRPEAIIPPRTKTLVLTQGSEL